MRFFALSSLSLGPYPLLNGNKVCGVSRNTERDCPQMALDNWDRRYLAIAMQVAQWSKDPSSKMGAVIASAEGRLVAFGFNGFPKKVEDCQSRLHNPPIKYEMVVHAEANAALLAGSAAVGGTVYLYGRRPICGRCAGILIQAGIKRAVATRPPPRDEARANSVCASSQMDWAESGQLAIEMFEEAGVQFKQVHNKTAVEETFIDLMNWAARNAERNKDVESEEVARKLRDLQALVSATSSFDML